MTLTGPDDGTRYVVIATAAFGDGTVTRSTPPMQYDAAMLSWRLIRTVREVKRARVMSLSAALAAGHKVNGGPS